MGVPDGHPFFGNQYTDGGYIPGTYSYVNEAASLAQILSASGTTPDYSPNISANNLASGINKLPTNYSKAPIKSVLPNSFLGKAAVGIFVIGSLAAAGVAIYKFVQNRKIKKQIAQNGLCYFGTCTKCEAPLVESTYVVVDKDGGPSYIVCSECGEKNYAYYSDEKDLPNTDSEN